MTLYRKTALVSAEQFLPSEGKIPEGVFSDGLSDPRRSTAEWCLQTLEGRHTLRNGDYICTGPNGEKWNVEQSIFEATYELAALRTQAPDSWRPDREAVRKAVLAMEATIVWDKERKYKMPYRVRDPLYAACAALRPQTAESGK